MTREKLERIKQAYNSGLKVQIWFNGYWENFDIRDYSMYSEPFSENRQYRIVGSAYADIAEKHIVELETQLKKCQALQELFEGKSFKLQEEIMHLHKRILELEKQNKELHQKITYLENDKEDIIANWYCDKVGECKVAELEKENAELKSQIEVI